MQSEKQTYTENTEYSIWVIFFEFVRFEILKTMLPNIQVSWVVITWQEVDTV
jgi:hypothetical protein